MKLIEVTSEKLEQRFLDLVPALYEGDPNYVRPLDQDLSQVFDRQRNRLFRTGDAIRWILEDEKGKALGRIAAFYDDDYAGSMEQPTGGFGFFECVNDQKAADMLLGAAKSWLESKGMEAMDGPINFGDKRAWWGILIEGFYPPTYQMTYNKPYLPELIENFGARIYYKQVVFQRNIQEPASDYAKQCLAQVRKDPGYSFDHFRKNNLEKYAADFAYIFNNAWGNHEGFKKVEVATVLKGFRKAKPVLYERLMFFAYYKGEPIAFFIMIPDLNPIIKNFNGKLGLWHKILLKYHLMRQTHDRCFGQIFGVIPSQQGKGVDQALVAAAGEIVHPDKKNRYNHMEMTWIGDFNPKMLSVAKAVGGEVYKYYATYRMLFDPQKPFHRHPVIGVDHGEEE